MIPANQSVILLMNWGSSIRSILQGSSRKIRDMFQMNLE